MDEMHTGPNPRPAAREPELELARLRARVVELETELRAERASPRLPAQEPWLLADLTEREALLSQAERIAHVGSWAWDLRTGRVTWSEELFRILGRNPERDEPGMESFLDCVVAEDAARVRDLAARVTLPDVESKVAFKVRRKDGAVRELVAEGRRMRDDAGRVVRVVGVVHDVTDWRDMERQVLLGRKMEALGRLAGGVAHDFNNALTVILGDVHLLRARHDEPELAEIAEAAESAALLVRQLLAFSRRSALRPELLDLGAAVESALPLVRRVTGEDIVVRCEAPAEPAFVRLDLQQFQQALLALAMNAREACPRGGRLAIAVRGETLSEEAARALPSATPGPHAVVEVSDDGDGMDEATRARAFEPFFTTKEPGHGLGLSGVFGTVLQSGGTVQLESAPGRGTTVRMWFPRVAAPPAARRAGTPRPATVLLVEDDPAVRRVATEALVAAGHRVLAAGDATGARRLAASHAGAVSLLVTDLVLPDARGRELADELMRAAAIPRTLYVSGWGPADDDVPCSEAERLAKPFAPDALLAAVARSLA